MSERDWREWHGGYSEPGSPQRERLRLIQLQLARFLDARAGSRVRVVSACAGQGHDLLGVLAPREPRPDVAVRLIELDEGNASAARESVASQRLEGIEVVCGDASLSDAYLGAVPADLVLMCGVFGNISDDDVRNTIAHLPELCAADGVVVWTRHTHPPDLTVQIRRWFGQAGFEEEAFASPGPRSHGVGVARLACEPRPLRLGRRLFRFATGYLILADEIIAQLDDVTPVRDGYTCRYRTTAAFPLIDPRLRRALTGGRLSRSRRGSRDLPRQGGLALALPDGRRLEDGFSIRLDPNGEGHIDC